MSGTGYAVTRRHVAEGRRHKTVKTDNFLTYYLTFFLDKIYGNLIDVGNLKLSEFKLYIYINKCINTNIYI